MKRAVFIGILFFFLSVSNSQTTIFLQGGTNYSLLQKPTVVIDKAEFGPMFSYTYGIGFQKSLTPKIDYVIDINYNHYLVDVLISAHSAGGGGEDRYHFNLGYLALSVLPEYFLDCKRRVFIDAGFYFALTMDTRYNGKVDGRIVNGEVFHHKISGNFNDVIRDWDIGLMAGGGYRFRVLNRFSVVPVIHYSFGLRSIEDPNDPEVSRVISGCYAGCKMRALTCVVRVGYTFGK